MRHLTQFLPECRIATTSAAESASLMMFPPWTFPAGFASWGVISCAITSRVAETGFASADIASSSPCEDTFEECILRAS